MYLIGDKELIVMFLGYQGDLLAFAAETEEALNSNMMTFDRIEETSEPVERVGNAYIVGASEIKEAKSALKRKRRDGYLSTFVDGVVSNPLRWASMSEDEKNIYKNYRQYLLDLPMDKDFPEVEILTLEKWIDNPISYDIID